MLGDHGDRDSDNGRGRLASSLAFALSLVVSACGSGDRYAVILDGAAGLAQGNEVRVAGVAVGEVVDVRFVDNRAQVAIEVGAGTPIYADARAYTDPNNTFGEKHLKIISGETTSEPLSPGSTIMFRERALDVPIVLNQFKPLVEDTQESSYPKIVRGIQVWNGLLSLAFGDPAVDPAPTSELLDDAGMTAKRWGSTLKSWVVPIRTQLDDTERAIVQVVSDQLLGDVEARLAAVERELPEELDRLEEELSRIEAKLDAYDLETVAGTPRSLDRAAIAVADMRLTVEAFGTFDRELLPFLRDLLIITGKAKKIDGPALRQFMQIEGTRSHWDRMPPGVGDRLQKLGADVPTSPLD